MKKIFSFILFTLLLIFGSCLKKQVDKRESIFINKYIEHQFTNKDSANYYFGILENINQKFTLENQSYYWSLKGFRNNVFSKYYLSKNNFDNALRIATSLNNDTLKAIANKGLAEMYKQVSETEKAIVCYLNALKIYEKRDDKKEMASVYSGMAGLYQESANVEKSFFYIKKTQEVLKIAPNIATYLIVLHIKANLFGMNNQLDSALVIDDFALKLTDSLKLPKFKSQFLNNKALCYLFGGEPKKSEPYFLQCIAIDSANGDTRLIADSYIFLAKLYLDLKNETKANYYNEKSLLLSKQIKNNFFIAACYANKTEAFTSKGDYKSALAYKDSVVNYTNKTNNETKEKTQIELTELYESEKKDNLLLEKNDELFRIKMISGFVILLTMILVIVAFVFFKNYKKINRLQTEKIIEDTNQNERIRISRDLHDNMGAFTTSLLGQIESLDWHKNTIGEMQVTNLRTDAENIMSTLRETIWILKTKTISVNQFFELLKTYITKNLSSTASITNYEDLTTLKDLSPTVSLNLYRITQEIVQNIMKHAEAKHITVNLISNQTITIEITDDGKGFDYKALKRKSGLENLEYRANEIKYHINIISEIGKGTTFSITGI